MMVVFNSPNEINLVIVVVANKFPLSVSGWKLKIYEAGGKCTKIDSHHD